jgi:hypothetical protein
VGSLRNRVDALEEIAEEARRRAYRELAAEVAAERGVSLDVLLDADAAMRAQVAGLKAEGKDGAEILAWLAARFRTTVEALRREGWSPDAVEQFRW